MECELIKGKTEEEEIELCLNCPRLSCVYEFSGRLPRTSIAAMKALRNAQIKKMRKQGWTVKGLALEFNLSERTIQWVTQKNARKVA